MSDKPKMTRDTLPSDFTLGLALVDALPVLLFGASMIVIGRLFHSRLFLLGALLCLLGGAGKVLWKILVVLMRRNIWFLFIQMRFLMPGGFFLMILSVFMNLDRISPHTLLQSVLHFPSVLFFAAGFAGMFLMGVFAVRLDSSDAKANWIEQLTNALAQACILIGLLFYL